MDRLDVAGRPFTIARATPADVPELVALLADDVLGAGREASDLDLYRHAFERVDADPDQFLAIVRDEAGAAVGTLQLTLTPGLSRQGAIRLTIEGVRVAASTRDTGLGTALFAWAHDHGRRHGATLAQLTSDVARPDAHRFYERLGYTPSHTGFKLPL